MDAKSMQGDVLILFSAGRPSALVSDATKFQT
jgi:hypothetical protein